MSTTTIKDVLYAQVGRLAKSMANAKRLELVELLCQAPKSVDALATEAGISITLASAHLKELRLAHVVESEKVGRQVIYRISCPEVAGLLVAMRSLAQDRLADLRDTLQQKDGHATWDEKSGSELAQQAERGEIVVIDVRPVGEFSERHLPNAVSMPLAELPKRLRELPKDKPVIAYCRGPFCLMSLDAVKKLRAAGFDAWVWREGAADWIAGDAAAAQSATAKPAKKSRSKSGVKS
jgi:rhodanese-related sulfurtransferase/DNA-binding transcriptional ArsR family regulator